ncbi:MAG: hypothetical protein ACXW08_16785 [Solirubrobacteraceae bacterium]
MRKIVRSIAVAVASVALVAGWSAPAGAQELRGSPTAPCPTTPTYDPGVPTPQSVLGFPLGLGQPQPVTSDQILRYVEAVDAASDRVISFDIGTTWAGRPLKVAIVSSRDHMRPGELKPHPRAVRRAARGPRRARRQPARLAGDRVAGGQRPRR